MILGVRSRNAKVLLRKTTVCRYSALERSISLRVVSKPDEMAPTPCNARVEELA